MFSSCILKEVYFKEMDLLYPIGSLLHRVFEKSPYTGEVIMFSQKLYSYLIAISL